MPTSQGTSFLSEIVSGEPIPLEKLAYFRERLRNKLYSLVLMEFLRQQQENGLTKADLTRRIKRKPEQVTRWLATPSNWKLDTISDLLLGLGAELDADVSLLSGRPQRNYTGPDWLQTHQSIGGLVRTPASPVVGKDYLSTGSSDTNTVVPVITTKPVAARRVVQ